MADGAGSVMELIKSPWGPGLLFGVLIYRLGNRLITLITEGAQRFLASHERQAEAITTLAGSQDRLAGSIEEKFREDDDVRAAIRTLTAEVVRLGEKVDRVHGLLSGARAAGVSE
jgi:hypothetical protein